MVNSNSNRRRLIRTTSCICFALFPHRVVSSSPDLRSRSSLAVPIYSHVAVSFDDFVLSTSTSTKERRSFLYKTSSGFEPTTFLIQVNTFGEYLPPRPRCLGCGMNILINRFHALNNFIELNDLDSTLPCCEKKMKILFAGIR